MTKTCPHCEMPMIQRWRNGKRGGWNCNACAAKRQHAYRRSNPESVADARLWTYYRIRLVDWNRMFAEQDGKCAICKTAPELIEIPRQIPTGVGGWGRFVVDHDHDTGKVRGLLCAPCNVMLGMAGDDPERMSAAINYVEAHRG